MSSVHSLLITGGTGTFGNAVAGRIATNGFGEIRIFSRDEKKQDDMRRRWADPRIKFYLGDVRNEQSLKDAMAGVDCVFHAAALKQVPSCEYFPSQAVRTNVLGAETIARVISKHQLPIQCVVGISTDKACKPVNVMGMTKALQERIFVQANIENPRTRFVVARYGNVLASRGSVIPLFLDQADRGGPLTLTDPEMTRFLMTLDEAVEAVYAALDVALRGEIVVPLIAAARMADVAQAVIAGRPIEIVETGPRPGEKTHEILVSEEEAHRTVERGGYLVIKPMLPELISATDDPPFTGAEFSSADQVLDAAAVQRLLADNQLVPVPAA